MDISLKRRDFTRYWCHLNIPCFITYYFSASRKSKSRNSFFLRQINRNSNRKCEEKKNQNSIRSISEMCLLVLSLYLALIDIFYSWHFLVLLLYAHSYMIVLWLNRKTKIHTTLHVNHIMEYPGISLRSE